MCSATPERWAIRAHTAWVPEGSDGQGEVFFCGSAVINWIIFGIPMRRAGSTAFQCKDTCFWNLHRVFFSPAISQVHRTTNGTSLTRSENVFEPMKLWHR